MAKFYKIRIFSANKLSGGVMDGVYKVDLPEMLDANKRYMLDVESFHTASDDYFLHYTPYNITCPSLAQGNSYSTTADGPDYTLKTISGSTYNQTIDSGTIGINLQDVSFLRSKRMHIRLTRIDGSTLGSGHFGVNGSWALTLVVWECNE